jgi:hypothetical protein
MEKAMISPEKLAEYFEQLNDMEVLVAGQETMGASNLDAILLIDRHKTVASMLDTLTHEAVHTADGTMPEEEVKSITRRLLRRNDWRCAAKDRLLKELFLYARELAATWEEHKKSET